MRLKDKVALVTGGASGVGRAIVTQLGEQGLQRRHKPHRAALIDVAAVGQHMHADLQHRLRRGPAQEDVQVAHVGVDVPVAQEADQVQGAGLCEPAPGLPKAKAASTRLAPCSYTRPAPRALCPTSELPMSSSLGRPTAAPWARRVRWGDRAIRLLSVGIAAWNTASPASCRPMPTPSRIHRTTGPLRPGKPGRGVSMTTAVTSAAARRWPGA